VPFGCNKLSPCREGYLDKRPLGSLLMAFPGTGSKGGAHRPRHSSVSPLFTSVAPTDAANGRWLSCFGHLHLRRTHQRSDRRNLASASAKRPLHERRGRPEPRDWFIRWGRFLLVASGEDLANHFGLSGKPLNWPLPSSVNP
jgi:hypothetical protein